MDDINMCDQLIRRLIHTHINFTRHVGQSWQSMQCSNSPTCITCTIELRCVYATNTEHMFSLVFTRYSTRITKIYATTPMSDWITRNTRFFKTELGTKKI